jgi:predicted RNA methylase
LHETAATIATVIGFPRAFMPEATSPFWVEAERLAATRSSGPAASFAGVSDEWVEAFQAAGEARKTLGAFATPAAFAKALALATIPDTQKPGSRIVDPACGAGALLIGTVRRLRTIGWSDSEILESLHGMELDPAARDLCILMVWLELGATPVALNAMADRIRLGNALTHDWATEDLFDVVIMNPPWESLRHTVDGHEDQERAATIRRLSQARHVEGAMPPLFSLQGRGDANLYKAFLELAPHLLKHGGRIGAIIPAAFGSDDGMRPLREHYLHRLAVRQWTTFENRKKTFAIDGRYKFGVMIAERVIENRIKFDTLAFADDEFALAADHISITERELKLIGGPALMIPELTSSAEKRLLVQILTAGTPFFDGSLGPVRYRREADMTLDRRGGLFESINSINGWRYDNDGRWLDRAGRPLVPVVEGRMVGRYDVFQKSYVSGGGRTAIWTKSPDNIDECRSQFVTRPHSHDPHRIAICDVTSSTNTRTVHAMLVPDGWLCGNSAPVLSFISREAALAALAILNSLVFDWQARHLVGGLHLNKFYLARFAWPRLTDRDVSDLADTADLLMSSLPRGYVIGPRVSVRTPVDPVEAYVRIETIVSRGYMLRDSDLEHMLTSDSSHRRGFWRAYHEDKSQLTIAQRTIRETTDTFQRQATLAS